MTDVTKKYLCCDLEQEETESEGQKNCTAENKNSKNLETEKHGDHSYHKV